MRSTRPPFTCTACGADAAKWVGQCGACATWGTLVETGHAAPATAVPVPLAAVDAASSTCRPTGVDELDRVLGGGLVPGSVTLLGGEPGIGKSTLLLQALASVADSGAGCLLVCAEESAAQVKQRAARLGAVPDGLLVLPEISLPVIVEAIGACAPAVCVVDSIQTIADPEVASAAGSVAQVRGCAQTLARVAKGTDVAVVLVGHVTKDGALAGPRTLEHLVDTVLSFEGERHHALRLLAATKHRFGPTGELGLFEMTDAGMRGVDDPSGLLLGDHRRGVAGSAVVSAVEGRRPLLAEVQALVCSGSGAGPRRSAQGIDAGRLALLLAVLERRVGMQVGQLEVFVSAVGGIRLLEPAADLGIALAVASALLEIPLPADLVAFGEVGLGGELRQVPHGARRLAEAARLGFTQALVPRTAPPAPAGMHLVRAATLGEAVELLRRRGGRSSHPASPVVVKPSGPATRPLLTPVG